MNEESITEQWRSTVALPHLDAEGDVAERLVLLAHYGADFTIWGGARRSRYWDALTERVKAATYAGPGLGDWWQAMSRALPCAPRNASERQDLVHLMSYEPALPVLMYLRRHPDYLVLRVRVIADARRAQHAERSAAAGGEDDV